MRRGVCMTRLSREATDLYLARAERYVNGLEQDAPKVSAELFRMLGCPFEHDRRAALNVSLATVPDAADYLPAVLVAASSVWVDDAETTSLLGGISRAACLDTCIATVDGAYALAIALVKQIELSSMASKLDSYVTPDALSIMNDWLRPEESWSEFPSAYVLCQHLFGAPWCSLALPSSAKNRPWSGEVVSEFACQVVSKQRPPFLPGVCPAQAGVISLQLPDELTAS
jgi:hypothetical protein